MPLQIGIPRLPPDTAGLAMKRASSFEQRHKDLLKQLKASSHGVFNEVEDISNCTACCV